MLKQIISLFLTVAMVISMLPVQAIALEMEPESTEMILETEPVVEETEPTEAETEATEEETEPAVEEPEPTEEETEPTVEETEPTEAETEATEAETEPAETETESAGDEPSAMEKIETDPMLATATSGSCGTNAFWDYNTSTQTLTISGSGALPHYNRSMVLISNYGVGEVPWINYTTLIKTIIINEGITEIGDILFSGSSNLTSVEIPNTVKIIGGSAFFECTSLKSIKIPEGVQTIGENAFYSCISLQEITIPDSVTSLGGTNGWGCFYNCSSLKSATLGKGINTINRNLFQECSSLTDVTFRGNVTSIGEQAFYRCTSLASIDIPDSVVSIGPSAFSKCSNLREVTGLNGVISIGDVAFSDCTNLQKLDFKNSTPNIGLVAFRNCSSLVSIGSVANVGENAFIDCSNLQSVVIGAGATSIGNHAFRDCAKLQNVTIKSSAVSVGELAFYGCSSLKSISNVTNLGDNAFTGCSNLQTATIVNGATSIGYQAFFDCKNLKTAYLPESLVEIGSRAFDQCHSLSNVSIPSKVTKIGEFAFQSCSSLTEVTIPAGMTEIDICTFAGCYNITDVTILGKITVIDDSAFNSCASLKNINIPEGVTKINYHAFYGCRSLTDIILPASLTEVGETAFERCSSLTEITFKGDAPTIAADAFTDVTANAYYPAGNETWTEDVKQDYGGDITWKKMLDIEAEIPEENIYTYSLICGSVCEASGNNEMNLDLVLKPNDTVENVSIKLTLPEGFSFTQDTLETERTLQVETLSGETPVGIPTIYPIYVDMEHQTEEYKLKIEITAPDNSGEEMSKIVSEVFYRPEYVNNTAESRCPDFDADDYIFSLDSALGSGATYNQETARLCAMLSSTAYDKEALETYLLADLGFSNYVRYDDTKGEDHKIAYSFATKKVIVNGQIKNLVYVICRGTITFKEWMSNLTTLVNGIPEELHGGFLRAMATVSVDLLSYCQDNQLGKKDTIFVVTGHSRGAAVANLLGNWLNSFQRVAEKENISVYTFETPTVSRNIVSESSGYQGNENIFNFVNYQDIIRNAASMKYYGRYGTTRYFAFSTTEAGWSTHNDGYGSYVLPGNGTNYTMPEIFNAILYNCDPTSRSSISTALLLLKDLAWMSVTEYNSSPKRLGEELYHAHMKGYYESVVYNDIGTSVSEIRERTESALAYLLEHGRKHTTNMRIHKYNCPINLYVYDVEGAQVASIVDKVVTCNDDDLLVYVDGESLNVGMFDSDVENYTIEVVGYDDGTMTHCIQTVGVDGVESVQVRKEIPIVKGESVQVDSQGYVIVEGEENPEEAYDKFENEEDMENALQELEENHEYGDWTVTLEPICTMEGYEVRSCDCGKTEIRSIPATGEHSFVDGACKVCGAKDETCGENLSWDFDEDYGVLTISGTGAMTDYTAENPAPWSDYAGNVYSLVVESGVTAIGSYAFANMVEMEIQGSLPDTLTKIGEGAFSGCGSCFTNITIPAGVVEIGENAFSNCVGLTKITFQGDMPALADTLFSEDVAIVAYYPAGNATWADAGTKNYGGTVGWYAIDENGSVSGTCGEDLSWTFNGTRLTISGTGAMPDYSPANPAPWKGLAPTLYYLTIESGVTSIGSYAFAGLEKLGTAPGKGNSATVTILPASLTKVGENAFAGCTSLVKLSFLGNLPVMAETIFSSDMTVTAYYPYGNTTWMGSPKDNYGGTVSWYCCDENGTALEGGWESSVTWHFNPNSATLSINGSGEMPDVGARLGTAPWNAWKSKIKHIVIETGITSVSLRVFSSTTNLETVAIPDTVTYIGSSSFSGCTNLQAVELPAGLQSLGSYVFASTGLKEITIPASVEFIDTGAFESCGQLENVVFAGKVLEIYDDIFNGCTSLDTIRFKGDAPEYVSENAFYGITANAYYPGDNATWTTDVMQQYGGTITWQVWEAPTSGTCGDGLTWEYDDWYGMLTISGTGAMKNYSAAYPAPWSEFADYLYEITIESGVTSIGNYAFAGMDGVYEIQLPDTLTRIGEAAFSGFGSEFTEFTVPAGVTEIGKNAFSNCSILTMVTFQADKPAMAVPLFSEDMTLAVYYPADNDTWAGIAETNFGGNVSWYKSDENGNPFGTCGDNLTWMLNNNSLIISGTGAMADYSLENPAPWSGLASELRYLTIESGVTTIGSYAFAGMEYLTYASKGSSTNKLALPASVKKIGEGAFYGCSNLYRIDFQGDLPTFADTIFSEGMMVLCYYPANNATWSDEAKKNYGGTVRWYRFDENGIDLEGDCGDEAQWCIDPATGTLTITGTGEVYSIGGRTSGSWNEWTDKIEKVVMEDGITRIGDGAFGELPVLKEVILPDTLEEIGNSAFYGSANLETAQIPSSVTYIESYAFNGCSSLALTIPAGITDIQATAVQGVKSFAVDPANENYASESGMLLSKDKTTLIAYVVPKTTYTIPATVKTIAENAFYQCTSLTEITIPNTVQTIETYAFAECPNLATVELPQGITILEHRVFAESGLTEITIPDSVAEIDIRAFEGCEKLEKVIFAGEPKVHTIDYSAFESCTSLKTIELPDSVTTLGEYVFFNTALTKIRIPATLKNLGGCAFLGCSDLETVVIEGNLEELGWEIFNDCDSLISVRFMGDAPVSIDSNAFYGVYDTVNVYYPENNSTWTADVLQDYGGYVNWMPWESSANGTCGDGVTWSYDDWNSSLTVSGTGMMDDYAEGTAPWLNCNIKSIVVAEGVTGIGSYAFAETEASQIRLPDSLQSVGECALPGNLTSLDVPAGITSLYFANLHNLEQFNVAENNTAYTDVDGVLFSKDMTKLIRMPQCWVKDSDPQSYVEYIVPNTVVELCDGALNSCSFLRSVVLPESLQIIGDNAIVCYDEDTPKGPETITIPKNVTSIGTDALSSAKLVIFTGAVPAMADTVFSSCTKTAYYPANNETWTEDKLLDYGGDLTWIPYTSDTPTSGDLSETIGWNFDTEKATLTITGTGVMSGYNYTYSYSDFITPWLHLANQIQHVVIEEGITEIGNQIFKNHYALETVTLPESLQVICDSAFFNNPELRTVTLPEGLLIIEQGAFNGCGALESIRIPDTVTSIGAYAFFNCTSLATAELSDSLEHIDACAFAGCTALTEIRIPASVTSIGACAFKACTNVKRIVFTGDMPYMEKSVFHGNVVELFYPADNGTWTEDLPNEGILTWIPVASVENRIVLKNEELDGQTVVWIDGKEYAVTTVNSASYVDLPNGNAKTLVTYTYHIESASDPYARYPVGMKVWTLENADGFYSVTRQTELDNLLQYEGCSIRVDGTQGIRMITSIAEADKAALTGQGLAGYTLKEYGTAIAWASNVSAKKPLTLGKSYVSSNYAYSKAAGKDPIFAYVNGRMQYTNVMVGFILDQCKADIAMRPYIILEDTQGNEITLYGGIVERSIGYIAAQNHDAFDVGTAAHAYVWEIITHVYGEDYVPET